MLFDLRMSLKQKKQLRKNIIMFIIGIILLSISGIYLHHNDAEKVAIFSGFEVMWQKATIAFENVVGDNGKLLKRKYDMQKYFRELIKIANHNDCLTEETLEDLNKSYEILNNLKTSELAKTLPSYEKLLYELNNVVNQKCE